MRLAFIVWIRDRDRDDLPIGETGRAVRLVGQLLAKVAFESSDEDTSKLLWVRFDTSGESLWVEELEQSGEAFLIAVVRCGR